MKWIDDSSNKNTRNTLNVRRLTLFGAACALVAPLFSSLVSPAVAQPPAHAQPPSHAPAHAYGRDKKDKQSRGSHRRSGEDDYQYGDDDEDDLRDSRGRGRGGRDRDGRGRGGRDRDGRDRDGRDRDGRDRDGRDRDDRDSLTLEGVVTRDVSGSRFEMRSDDGRTVTVRVRQGEPRRLSAGDRVRVVGSYGRNDTVFVAERVRIVSNVPGGGSGQVRRVNFPGTVIDRTGRILRVRGDNGRTYTVESRSDLSRIDDGDRVRVVGDARNYSITNATVVLLRNTDRPGENNGNRTEFLGTVTRVDTIRDEIVVREDATGRTYTFRPRQAEDFRIGQRVRAYGRVVNGQFILNRVVRL